MIDLSVLLCFHMFHTVLYSSVNNNRLTFNHGTHLVRFMFPLEICNSKDKKKMRFCKPVTTVTSKCFNKFQLIRELSSHPVHPLVFAHVNYKCHSQFPCDALTGYWTSWPYHTFHSGNVPDLHPVPGVFSCGSPDSASLCFYKGRSHICTKHHHGCVDACSSLPCSWNYDHSLCVCTWNQGQLDELSCAVPTYF